MSSDRHDSSVSHSTLLEAVKHSLELVARYNASDVVAPAAILWSDAEAQWQPLVELLRPIMPELLTLGEYQPEHKTGPAIWLRCVIAVSYTHLTLPTILRV